MSFLSKYFLILVVIFLAVPFALARINDEPSLRQGADLYGTETTWVLEWDDTVDGELMNNPKFCTVRLSIINQKVTGYFLGPVQGRERTALFAGELFNGPNGSLLQMQQMENGYVCAYQLQRRGDQEYFGVWHDTWGGKGEVRLARRSLLPLRQF